MLDDRTQARALSGRDAAHTPSPARPITWSTIIHNILSLVLGSGISQFLLAFATLLTARQLGAAGFGEYAACFGASSLAAVLFNLGLDNWLLRDGASRPEKMSTSLGQALLIKTLAGIPWTVGVVGIFALVNPSTFRPGLMLLSALAVWCEGLATCCQSALKVYLRNQTTALLQLFSRGSLLILTLWLAGTGITAAMPYAWVRLGSMAATLAVTLPLLPVRPRRVPLRSILSLSQAVAPFALSDLLTAVYVQADTTLAGILLDKEQVGLYATASRLINALFMIPTACYSVVVPVMVRVFVERRERLRTAIVLNTALFAVLGVALWLPVWGASSFLPGWVLGQSFVTSGHLIAILSPILMLKALSFAAVVIIVVVNLQKERVYVQAASAIVNLGLNIALVSRFGVEGLAWVYVLSESVLLVGYTGLVFAWARRNRLIRRRD